MYAYASNIQHYHVTVRNYLDFNYLKRVHR